jgi:hypothetical protein
MVLVLSIVTLHGKIQQNSGTSWVISIHRNFQAFSAIQSNLYKNDTQGTWKCALYDQLSFIYRLKLYALFINGKKGGNKTLTFTLTICRRHETLMLEVGIRFQSYISDDRHVVTKSCQRPECGHKVMSMTWMWSQSHVNELNVVTVMSTTWMWSQSHVNDLNVVTKSCQRPECGHKVMSTTWTTWLLTSWLFICLSISCLSVCLFQVWTTKNIYPVFRGNSTWSKIMFLSLTTSKSIIVYPGTWQTFYKIMETTISMLYDKVI